MAINCVSRCMWCGRRTRHEWCHECYAAVNAGNTPKTDSVDDWHRFNDPPEICEFSDEECPQAQITREPS